MKAELLSRTRIVFSEESFAEMLVWLPPRALAGCRHNFKYRLAYVVRETCVLRYDNEAAKGDHRHYNGKQSQYTFSTPEQLITDFQHDITRWNHENADA